MHALYAYKVIHAIGQKINLQPSKQCYKASTQPYEQVNFMKVLRNLSTQQCVKVLLLDLWVMYFTQKDRHRIVSNGLLILDYIYNITGL